MKLQKDKNLVALLKESRYTNTTETSSELILHLIDTYLEEHGFHIYPVKKRPSYVPPPPDSCPSFEVSEIEFFTDEQRAKTIKSINRFKISDIVIVMDEKHPRYQQVGQTTHWAPLAMSVEFPDGKSEIIVNQFLDHFEFKKRAKPKEKGTVTFKEVEEKPSADVEETLLEQTIKNSLRPKDLDIAIQQNLAEMIVQKFTPFQRCPVCEGNGKKFDTNPFGLLTNLITCPCCEGAMVIPMKREERK